MNSLGQPRWLFFSIATFEPVSADTSLWFIQKAFEQFLQPYASRPGFEFCFSYEREAAKRFQLLKPNTVDWDKLRAASPFRNLVLSYERADYRNTIGYFPPVATTAVYRSDSIDRASTLEFSAQIRDLYHGEISPTLQAAVVEFAVATFERVQGVNGYITLDYVQATAFGSDSPYERFAGISHVWYSKEFRTKLRGYFWGNFLSDEHVKLLGGQAFLSSAPVRHVRRLSHGYYLQLTDKISEANKQNLQPLKSFLEPVIPPINPDLPADYFQRNQHLLV
jgi:hypothetical protein